MYGEENSVDECKLETQDETYEVKEKVGAIHEASKGIDDSINEITQSVAELEKMLSPILSPEKTSDVKEVGKPETPKSDIAHSLIGQGKKIYNLKLRIVRIMNRVEL